ncbi:serine phosphatase RsbU, regulator of sigma subunit [Beggiatoa alba B18LD]|uniref:Serine phosphatase RsbU, regulator of sigma subunit n=1 Tax=Beggiatoa alba B18LD TaxID=395493 RepID=I3CD89_9GAMM|nr:SpoIIE family protein phosphatase [Beggiatoa alba]EIJ41582.1 serine phosphatase RsbU, regulator of sigma subunit [Beggiatoa alba B18LD]
MKIQHKINLFMFIILMLLSASIVAVGYMVISSIVYNLSREIFTQRVQHVKKELQETYDILNSSGVSSIEGYVQIAQQEFLDKVSTYKQGETGYFYILDKATNIVLHPHFQRGSTFELPIANTMLQQKEGEAEYIYQEEKFYCVFTYFPEWDWLIVLKISEREMFAERKRYLIFVVTASIIITLIALLLLHFYTRAISQRIMMTLTCLKQIEQGNMKARITAIHDDEIGMIQASINSMVEMLAANEKLKAENVRMSAELSVAHQLQQMLLPKEGELTGINELEISGFMHPAEETGGDYYDVLEHDGHIIVGIGDVTGHGLESSVVMIMVQTAVRTLLTSGITDTEVFLRILNRTIHDNIKRMNSDKNLTFLLLDYQQNGLFKFSGQHEEILFIRDGGQIERFDTIDLGFPIGIETDINSFISHIKVELQQGEGVVLYTDGITEARNKSKQQYSVERLCAIISAHWHQSASAITQAVINDLKNHTGDCKLSDDITLVVLKKN